MQAYTADLVGNMRVQIEQPAQGNLSEKKKAEEPIVWTYNKVLLLMQIIRAWIERDVPASQMGIFLVEVLYQTDKHMNSRVTKLVDDNESYENIAKAVVEFFQIHDEWLQPLWTKLIPGDPDLRPGIEYSPEPMSEASVNSGLLQEYEGNILLAPKPVRCVYWPFFPSMEELQTKLNGKDSKEGDLNEVNDHTDGDIPCYGGIKRNTTTISHTGPLPILEDFISSGNYMISPYLTQQPSRPPTSVRKSRFLGNIIGTRSSSVIRGEYLKKIRQSRERPLSSFCVAS